MQIQDFTPGQNGLPPFYPFGTRFGGAGNGNLVAERRCAPEDGVALIELSLVWDAREFQMSRAGIDSVNESS